MKETILSILMASLMLLQLPSLSAQHCGGPCEVPRPAGPPVSPNPKFTLVPGKEKTNWRYLHNFIWTEDGKQKYSLLKTLSSPQMLAFGLRQIFVSPAGNGFLVTGNPYAGGDKFILSGRTHAETPPLFVFCDPRGTPIVEVPLKQALTSEELKTGPCPSDCGCSDILYVFEKGPALSPNGCFVEFVAAGTGRKLAFFLPLGAPILDRTAFEDRLAGLDWARVPSELQEKKRSEIMALLKELDDPDFKTRSDADKAMKKMGLLALPLIRSRLNRAGSPEAKLRARHIEESLWTAVDYEGMSIDLDLLQGLLSYPETAVGSAVRARLTQILPEAEASDWGDWIGKHRDRLQWKRELGRYTLKDEKD